MPEAQLHLLVANDLSELSRIYEFIDQTAETCDLPDDTRRSIALVIEELFSNTVSYGYPSRTKDEIRITIECARDGVTIHLLDNAQTFDISEAPVLDLTNDNIDDMKVGGLGLFLVHQISRDIRHERTENGNSITIELDIERS
ncbi:ATP-binding protein [Roseibium denhamense]|uniref:Serine/threonine-protein kinase RsbW n=1 Tax=Roseibium denhamense TaxID=76305 RepID=A0ABY1NWI7_9HYPH|nr:ATP-binding protein [Roseibium denhamense]MTI04873.1 ATP-binding protein [Roseibium denhamense]SMP20317.1 serine/threonine-protein kinase RsbW [Roseibium denhamense]